MPKNVTDRIILKEIYSQYYSDFCAFQNDPSLRSSKIYVPIDCKAIAKKIDMDPEIIFGRLYYHLNRKHGYKQDDGSLVHLFALKAGGDMHAVNFPLLSAVVAELEQSYIRFTVPIVLSLFAIAISVLGFIGVGI